MQPSMISHSGMLMQAQQHGRQGNKESTYLGREKKVEGQEAPGGGGQEVLGLQKETVQQEAREWHKA